MNIRGEVKGLYVNVNNTVPDCENGNWNFVFAVGGKVSKAFLGMLLTIRIVNTIIKVVYTPKFEVMYSVIYF
jgi:hypothetical protein